MKEIFNRRSIRKFKDQPVEQEKVEQILRAAMQAPSAANQQPWEFIVVKDKQALDALSQISPYAKPVASAGVAIILLADSNKFKIPTGWQQDMGAAAENILLEVVSQNLGAVWLGVSTMDEIAENVSKLYNLPENILPFAAIAIGYPDGQENVFVDRYDEARVHYEKW